MLSIILALVCAPTIWENRTQDPWNDQDKSHYKTAEKRCGEIYKKSPCVKRFIKRSTSDYSVICSQKTKNKGKI